LPVSQKHITFQAYAYEVYFIWMCYFICAFDTALAKISPRVDNLVTRKGKEFVVINNLNCWVYSQLHCCSKMLQLIKITESPIK
jgi:hypothetical protein